MTPPVFASFEAAYREHFVFAWRALRRLGVPDRDLGDATQDVFVVVYRKIDQFDFERAMTTWIYAICLRVASNRRRSATARHELLADSDEASDARDVASAPDAEPQALAERRALLRAALDAMSLEQRAVFTLFELEGHTGEEVAAILGVPAPTVRSRLRLAREVFRQRLERHRAQEHFELRRTGGER